MSYSPKTIKDAWDNHFSAFGSKDMDKILKDYDEKSVITVFNPTTQNKNVYKGVEGARSLFKALWEEVSDFKTLAAPVVDIDEGSKSVFLVWECKGCGVESATDTFLFGDNLRILRQNIFKVTVKSCCPPGRCSLLPPTDYTPKGKTAKLGGLDYYEIGDAKGGKAVVVLPDVFGWLSGRQKAICDEISARGYFVVMPDLFHGDKVTFPDLKTNRIVEFLKTWPAKKWQPDMDSVYKYLAEKGFQGGNIGMVGFCWGTWAIFCESARDSSRFAAGANFHPSVNIEELLGGSIETLTEKVANPMLVVPCKGDHAKLQKGGAANQILDKKNLATYLPMPDMAHGFMSQGDVTNEEIRGNVKTCMDAMFAQFDKFLTK